MPLDPGAKAIIDLMDSLGGLNFANETAPEARARLAMMRAPIELEPVGSTRDISIPGPAGDIPARLYTPKGAGPHPLLMWFHGGGWVLGDLDGGDVVCCMMANRGDCAVLSVDYRLAPESKFPAAADDCYAATVWAADNASALGIDADRMAVGGDSAGGNLAAVVSQLARDNGGPRIALQALVYPVTNHDLTTGSYRANAEGYLLTKDAMVWFWNHYLGSEADGANPLASPLRAASFAGLPPALVITAEYDPLCDEGEAYAAKLAAAGVPTQCTRYDGMIHGFYGMANALPDGLRAVEQVSGALRTAFSAVSV